MTIKEKFKQWLDTNPRLEIREVQLEVIADNYAIELINWYAINGSWIEENLTSRELLEIFKKEKGL